MRINCAGESGIVYRILIVDDEKIERTGLRLLLGKMDQKFEITEAVNLSLIHISEPTRH